MKRFYTLNCWRIDAAFIAAYPEFGGDIPTYNSVPRKIDDKRHDEFYYQEVEEVNGNNNGGNGNTQVVVAAAPTGPWVCDNGRWYAPGGVR